MNDNSDGLHPKILCMLHTSESRPLQCREVMGSKQQAIHLSDRRSTGTQAPCISSTMLLCGTEAGLKKLCLHGFVWILKPFIDFYSENVVMDKE